MSPAFFCKTMEARCICKGMAARFRNAVGAKFCEAREAMPTEPRRPQGSQSGAQVRDKACWQIETSQGGGSPLLQAKARSPNLEEAVESGGQDEEEDHPDPVGGRGSAGEQRGGLALRTEGRGFRKGKQLLFQALKLTPGILSLPGPRWLAWGENRRILLLEGWIRVVFGPGGGGRTHPPTHPLGVVPGGGGMLGGAFWGVNFGANFVTFL